MSSWWSEYKRAWREGHGYIYALTVVSERRRMQNLDRRITKNRDRKERRIERREKISKLFER